LIKNAAAAAAATTVATRIVVELQRRCGRAHLLNGLHVRELYGHAVLLLLLLLLPPSGERSH